MPTVACSRTLSRALSVVSPVLAMALVGLSSPALASGVGPNRACRGRSGASATVASAAASPLPAAAASVEPVWLALPLYGGEMTSTAVDPTNAQVAYVGTRDAGVFKTVDGGASWQPARTGLTFTAIRTLRVDPTNASTLWAGTDFDGVWKSLDGGATWAPTGTGLPASMVVFNIAIDPGHGGTLYAGLAGGVAFSIGAVFKSVDGGTTWQEKDAGIPRYDQGNPYTNGVFALALNPARPAELAAGTVLDGAFHSTDGGETWTAINGGVPFMPGSTDWREEIEALGFDPYHADRLTGVIDGQFYSFDSGTWVQQSTGYSLLGFMSSRLYFHPTKPDVLFAIAGTGGLYTSTDGGVDWTEGNSAVMDVDSVIDVGLSTSEPNTIFAARDNAYTGPGGVMRSPDLGVTWTEASEGISALEVQSVAIDPHDPRAIYAGTGTGFVFASHDGGQSWTKALRQYGASSSDFNFGSVSSMVVDPLDSRVITAATFLGLYRSTDRGATFTAVAGISDPLAVAVASGATESVYFVGSSIGNGVSRSLDGGATWTQANQGLPIFGGYLNPILAVAIDPNDDKTVWVGTQYGGGILRTTDGGESWQSRGLTDENFVEAISVTPGNGDEILVGAGFESGSIYKSVDGGATWQVKLADIGFVECLVRDPRDPRVVYAGSEGYGVLRSIDGGETWQDYSGEIFYPLVYSLAISSGDQPLLLAGSYGAGLYATSPPAGNALPRVRRKLLR